MRKQYETDLKEMRRRYKKMRRKKKNTLSNVLTNVMLFHLLILYQFPFLLYFILNLKKNNCCLVLITKKNAKSKITFKFATTARTDSLVEMQGN